VVRRQLAEFASELWSSGLLLGLGIGLVLICLAPGNWIYKGFAAAFASALAAAAVIYRLRKGGEIRKVRLVYPATENL